MESSDGKRTLGPQKILSAPLSLSHPHFLAFSLFPSIPSLTINMSLSVSLELMHTIGFDGFGQQLSPYVYFPLSKTALSEFPCLLIIS